MQPTDVSNGISSMNNSVNGPSPSTTSVVTAASLLHQHSTTSCQENHASTSNIPYDASPTAQIPSASSSSSLPPSQTNPSSPFPSPSANNVTQHWAPQFHEADPGESQSAMQQILQEMMSSQINGVGTLVNEMKGINEIGGTGIGGMRAAMNQMSQDATVLSHQQQQEMGNRLLGGIRAVNSFNNLQFDWKTLPQNM